MHSLFCKSARGAGGPCAFAHPRTRSVSGVPNACGTLAPDRGSMPLSGAVRSAFKLLLNSSQYSGAAVRQPTRLSARGYANSRRFARYARYLFLSSCYHFSLPTKLFFFICIDLICKLSFELIGIMNVFKLIHTGRCINPYSPVF